MTLLSNAWARFAVALGMGGLGAFGQAPYDHPFLLLAALAGAMALFQRSATPQQAAAIGWGFGVGYFLHSLTWLLSPFMVDAERYAWMAPFALVLMCCGLALFWMAAFCLSRWLSPKIWPLIFCLSAAELLRGYVFTGFPWGQFSQALVDTWSGQGLAVIGPYGMTLVFVGMAVLFCFGVTAFRHKPLIGITFNFVLVGLLIIPFDRGTTPLTDATIRLVQPNAAQKDKWNPEMIPVFFKRQLDFTQTAPPNGGPKPDLILWAETAIPWPLDIAGGALSQISVAASGTPVVLGVQRRDGMQFYNSAVLVGQGAEVLATYDKHHLVPFGEYVPFGDVLANVGISSFASQLGNGYSSGPGAQLMDLGRVGKALPLICYEAVFARHVNETNERPAFLMQLTNDAWFGKGQGPLQHLAQARMRAIEQGLPMARVANTGVSAMIDPWGQITHSLALNTAGFLDAPLPKPRAATPYSRFGEWPIGIVLLIGLGFLIMLRMRKLTFDAQSGQS